MVANCDITTCHLQTCPQLVIPCPNNECNERLPRCDISNHRQTCPLEEVACKYSMIGCEQKPLPKELHVHEKDDQLHLPLAMETILQIIGVDERCDSLFGLLEVLLLLQVVVLPLY